MDIKRGLRGFLVAVFAYLLVICLLFLVNMAIFSGIWARPDRVASIINDSGTYQRVPSLFYERFEDNITQFENPGLDDAEFKQAVIKSFDTDIFKAEVEKAIDETYAWLNGQKEQPEFKIGLQVANKKFLQSAVEVQADRVKKMPACSSQQLAQMQTEEVNIFTLECLPPDVNLDKLEQITASALTNNTTLYKNSNIDSTKLKNKQGQPLFKANDHLPDRFQLAKKLPLVLGVMVVLLIVGLYMASVDKKKGLKRIAKILAGAGIITLAAPLFIKYNSNLILRNFSDDKFLVDIVNPLNIQFYQVASTYYYLCGLGMLLVAIIVMIMIKKNILTQKKVGNEAKS